ncbi:hypothetical protein [Streptomyces sp. H34-S4]|uniref:DUF7848 domain-containing protein n=1 Tax=Streptomyces sp. H34-S4 TaxID=2996463 RepID=UPI002270352E|nr:hypothetical protein [Streptomyces sp. H34-S4]MCY0933594.1 hypothetical protein [Streptomyces sp. H34-S4]
MSQPRAVLAFKMWTIRPDRDTGSAPVTHAMKCAACGEQSDATGEWEAPQSWALEHSGRNPSHTTYSEIITRPYVTQMSN